MKKLGTIGRLRLCMESFSASSATVRAGRSSWILPKNIRNGENGPMFAPRLGLPLAKNNPKPVAVIGI